ncbi:MAG: DUF1289 domain-containing protein [Rhodospirillaceae bacterium]
MTLPPTPTEDVLSDEDVVASPCVSVCTMDRTSGLCIGCLRTIKEIGAWRTMTMAEKRATVAACAERAKNIAPRGKDWQPLDPSSADMP